MDHLATLLTPLAEAAGIGPWVFLGLCGASFVGSMIAASVGLGGGVLVLASMAMVLPPAILIPLHGVVQAGSNFGRASLMARHAMWRLVPPFAVGTVIGSALGANIVFALPIWLLQLVLGLFVLFATWAPRLRVRVPDRAGFLGVGLVSGFVTLFIGGSAPVVAPFLFATSTGRRQFVATLASLMVIQHIVKIVALGVVGFAFGPYVPLLIGLMAFGFAGTMTGRMLLNKLPERVFAIGLKVVLTLLSTRLIYSAIAA